jgi:bacterioferritin (cytochrome b1)
MIKKRVKYLIKNKLIDLVSTDAHCNPDVYDDLEKAINYVENKQKQPLFDLLEHIQSS